MSDVEFKRVVRRLGGSLKVPIPPPFLEAFEINEGDTVVLTACGDGILMRKCEDNAEEKEKE